MTSRVPSQPLISKLLSLGDRSTTAAMSMWSKYITDLNLGNEDIPELIDIAVDQDLNHAPIQELVASAPIHARRALGKLRAINAIEPLMELFHQLENNDWVNEELPKIYGMIGSPAISSLQNYLANNSHQLFSRLSAINSLEEIAKQNHEQQTQVIKVLTQQLQKYTDNSPELNSFIITSLVNLQATQSSLVIKQAFENDCVSDEIVSDWETIRTNLGINSDHEVQDWEEIENTSSVLDVSPPETDTEITPPVTPEIHVLSPTVIETPVESTEIATSSQAIIENPVELTEIETSTLSVTQPVAEIPVEETQTEITSVQPVESIPVEPEEIEVSSTVAETPVESTEIETSSQAIIENPVELTEIETSSQAIKEVIETIKQVESPISETIPVTSEDIITDTNKEIDSSEPENNNSEIPSPTTDTQTKPVATKETKTTKGFGNATSQPKNPKKKKRSKGIGELL